MEKYIIRANNNSKYGYDFVIVSEDGSETIKELTSKTTDGYLRLPDNPLGQKMVALKKLGFEDYELQQYEGRHTSSKGSSNGPTKKDDFLQALALCLDKDERAIFLDLCDKAKSRFEIFKKKEALKKQIAQAEEALKQFND